jgi:hypothetical protein
VGVKFTSDVAGAVTGVRFYKGSGNIGTHTGSLWSASGTRLATATFTNETSSGWQTVTFSTPVQIAAGTTYLASYFAPKGHYAVTASAFATVGLDRAPLHIPIAGAGYLYGSSGGFPSKVSNHNYWVDVVFQPAS